MHKGLDSSFINYGIRKQDLAVLSELCQKHEIDFEWLKEYLLKNYHELKVSKIDMEDSDVVDLISKALQKIK